MEEINSNNFENFPVDISEIYIPEIEEIAFLPIEKSFLKVMLLQFFVFVVIIGIAAFVLVLKQPLVFDYRYLFFSGIFILLFFILVFIYVSFKRKAFQIRTHDVIFRQGIWSTKTTVLPINRIQQVKLYEGVFSKMFKLASIGIYTAGGHANAQIKIPGVKVGEAHKIRTFLISKIKEFNE